MNRDEIIDFVLLYVSTNTAWETKFTNISLQLINRGVTTGVGEILQQMANPTELDLLLCHAQTKFHSLSLKGRTIQETGGWLNHLKREKEKEDKKAATETEQETRLRKIDEKLDQDIENGKQQGIALTKQINLHTEQLITFKRQNRWFKITFPIAIIGGVLATADLWEQMNKILPITHLEQPQVKKDTTTILIYRTQQADTTKPKPTIKKK